MCKKIIEPSKELEVFDSYDVVVIGGGIAGVAAAISASRGGARTLLVEKYCALGGLATLGLVIIYLPLCDGMGQQVSFGLAEEMLLLMTKDGSCEVPDCWKPDSQAEQRINRRYALDYNAASAILLLEEFIKDNGVSILYDTHFSGVVKNADRIDAVILENKSGRFAIECGGVVDATGDADVCFAAGEKTVSLDTNTACGWYYYQSQSGMKSSKLYTPFDENGEILLEGVERGYQGDDGFDVTQHILDSRDMMRREIAKIKSKTGDEKIWPFLIPTFPCFRMTRRLVGQGTFLAEDRKEFSDSIGLIADWRKKGPVYSIPFASIAGVETKNLFAAGRCISAKGYGWDQSRVIPACAVTGQAAGLAAKLAAGSNDIDIKALQENLKTQNCKLSMDS